MSDAIKHPWMKEKVAHLTSFVSEFKEGRKLKGESKFFTLPNVDAPGISNYIIICKVGVIPIITPGVYWMYQADVSFNLRILMGGFSTCTVGSLTENWRSA